MARLSALIGIGFMLVGALAYALPSQQDAYRLVPSLVGLTISLVGLLSAAQARALFGSMVSCFLLIVYSITRLIPDSVLGKATSELISDISIILFALIFISVAQKHFRESAVA